MPTAKQKLGTWGELLAAEHLRKKGYLILDHHYTDRFGEIDLIAKDGEQVVFVEVKTRMGNNCGLPEEAVNRNKAAHLRKPILAYVSEKNISNFRFDVVAIDKKDENNTPEIRHHIAVSDVLKL